MVIISLCEYLMRLVKKNIYERYHKEIEIIAWGTMPKVR